MSAHRRPARSVKPRLAVSPTPATLFSRPVQFEASPRFSEAQALLIDRIARDLVEQAINQDETPA